MIIGGYAHFKSDAAVRILDRLPRLWWSRWHALVPRILRDAFYYHVARSRYRNLRKTGYLPDSDAENARHYVVAAAMRDTGNTVEA